MLFQIDLAGDTPAQVFEHFWEGQLEADAPTRAFAERLVSGVTQERPRLDRAIVDQARNWRLERMAVVDRNVLRLAVWELLFDPETPAPVVIDEAVEVARRYGSEQSASFINGVLDAVRRAHGAPGP
jgi:N utilization substance protein B